MFCGCTVSFVSSPNLSCPTCAYVDILPVFSYCILSWLPFILMTILSFPTYILCTCHWGPVTSSIISSSFFSFCCTPSWFALMTLSLLVMTTETYCIFMFQPEVLCWNFEQYMVARNRIGIGLSYRPVRLHSLAELVPWNRFLGSLKLKNSGSVLDISSNR